MAKKECDKCNEEFEDFGHEHITTCMKCNRSKKTEQSETQIKVEKEQQEKQQKNEEKSVHVKSFSMPFGDMVMFMVKWAIASIPAFIILFIIGAIFTTIFGVSLLSIFR